MRFIMKTKGATTEFHRIHPQAIQSLMCFHSYHGFYKTQVNISLKGKNCYVHVQLICTSWNVSISFTYLQCYSVWVSNCSQLTLVTPHLSFRTHGARLSTSAFYSIAHMRRSGRPLKGYVGRRLKPGSYFLRMWGESLRHKSATNNSQQLCCAQLTTFTGKQSCDIAWSIRRKHEPG